MELVMLIWGVLAFLLGVMALFKDEIKAHMKEEPRVDEEEMRKKKEAKEQFEKIMNYSFEDAIKRGDR